MDTGKALFIRVSSRNGLSSRIGRGGESRQVTKIVRGVLTIFDKEGIMEDEGRDS
jgi:hypothetical protein